MCETPKKRDDENTGRSYYYDDATGYEVFDPDAPDDDELDETAPEASEAPLIESPSEGENG